MERVFEDRPFLDRILQFGPGGRFCRFANEDGKTWIMPRRNMRTAMNLYQPSGPKGKLVKWGLPWLSWSGLVKRVIHAGNLSCILRPDLTDMLVSVLGVEDFEFSVFGGTPCTHQKVTVQLSAGDRILAYCKLSDNAEVVDLFRREAETLSELNRLGMGDCVPRALFCGALEDGVGVFVQSTAKTGNSRVLHRWSSLQEDFLNRLQRVTCRRLRFEESDFCRAITDLREHLDWLPEWADREPVSRCIEYVLSRYAGQTVAFGACHGDFTPWNMFVEKGRLFVFDFEYLRFSCPAGLDRCHFFTQTAIFERHWQAEEIISFLRSPETDRADRELYLCYLLDIVSRFTLRERGHVSGDVDRSFRVWLDLLDELNQ